MKQPMSKIYIARRASHRLRAFVPGRPALLALLTLLPLIVSACGKGNGSGY
jgi:hypothetical protein